MDESNDPLFPFGLSYSRFAYVDLKIDESDQKRIKVSATLSNVSEVAGEEVVQLYIRDRVATVTRPVKELKGFTKLHLEPEQFVEVTFGLTPFELGFYDSQDEFAVEPGTLEVMVGTSSKAGLTGDFELTSL